MSDDLNKKIRQITDILGQENLPDNVKGLLTLLAGSDKSNEKEAPKELPSEPIRNESRSHSEMEENMEMLSRAKKIFDKINTKDDPRINLLYSMKPFLNNNRQKKLGTCIKLLQMYNLSKLMDDTDKSFL
ncbi:hypothetical protein [Pseudobacteroides cellulosolvens]|uniref:Uncharacterized protein n=1 Tax=Pseudobacteroides cellulosolvens ATCC 35603 = DSM 2933 TaxID=398512 RepID=A0A0L6JP26_9FIRM|nr:hypothetical protein [Pseudobacteroides cellulosolvens]KNY27117.1 hypothetical protein Bccel_2382 [Pseudobacteroides cellulosolvens ATCC 35603 = DSM 2933]